jgi:hypothetical protein
VTTVAGVTVAGATRVAGVVALVLGATLALVGMFLPLYTQVFEFPGGEPFRISQDSWTVTSGEVLLGRDVRYGVPVVVAVALLVLGAVRTGRMWGRLAAFGGAMLLTGAVWEIGQNPLALTAPLEGDDRVTMTLYLGLGAYTLAAATVIGLAGGLLVQDWPPRAPRPAGPVVYRVDEGDGDEDTDTPPFGLPGVSEERPP